jgi:hypothetical protein
MLAKSEPAVVSVSVILMQLKDIVRRGCNEALFVSARDLL